jgi:uncharacterized protein (TIGR03437 family)
MMRLNVCLTGCLTGILCGGSLFAATPHADLISTMPVIFEPADSSPAPGRYIAKGLGYHIEIGPRNNTLTWSDSGSKISVRTKFLRTRRDAHLQPLDQLPSHTNYFLGRSPGRWRTNVPNFAQVRVAGLYAGIDLVYHGARGTLEYDFVLHPGADPQTIEFEVGGAETVRIDPSGDLVLHAFGDQVRWNAPQLYQDRDGTRLRVNGGFEVSGRRVRFRVGEYDRSRPLVIDPALSYSSYLGGSANEVARKIATDSQGNVYLSGSTTSTNFALPGAFQTTLGGPADAFVAKFSSAGKLVYLTYLGGAQFEVGTSLAVDNAGNVYVTGMTNSSDFPVTSGAYQVSYRGGGGNACERAGDAFVTKLNPSGSGLVYSTYVGGSRDDFGSAIAIDASGNAYITGYTLSLNFPATQGAFQTSFQGSGGQLSKPICNGVNQAVPQPWFVTGDAFVTKLNSSGSQLIFSTYLGGALDDFALAIALDSSDNVYVGGFTLSQNFPVTSGALDNSFGGSEIQNEFFTSGDGFVSKLNSAGSSLIYSTYLGGSGDDAVTAVAVAADQTAWVTGFTSSLNFPIVEPAVQRTYGGYYTLPFLVEDLVGDGFASHVNQTGTALLYSTYLGGGQNDMGTSIAVDSAGLVYIVGFSDSANFPVTADAIQRAFAGDGGQAPYFQYGDGFVTVIDPVASRLIFSSYFGGSEDDQFWGLALDGAGGLWATGNTLSTNFPVTPNAWQPTFGGYVPTYLPKGDSLLVHFTNLAASGPALAALQNSASSAGGSVSPGMIFTLYGSGIGPAVLVGASLDANGKLATAQSGVTITFDGVAAPIVYVSATQVAGVVPYELAGNSSTQVVVHYNGQDSAPLTVTVASAVPGLFSANFSGSGPAVAFNQDTSLNSSANPAAKGSIVVLFGTGEGQTRPPGVDGEIASQGLLPKPQATCTATVGGLPATILYCGAVPFVVEGEFQLNLQLSPDTPGGSQPVVVTIGSAQSQPNLTVFVQ